ncbi:PAS domain-containing serine/threonine-protein kinase [Anabrus simplex]|uniref:PAS domain-containing serine/threonine-protein kinase n=1 Tax=Anabrus simplex TaxID=316456 RepID=UPI0035A2904D
MVSPRGGKQKRALALGWTGWRDFSFEGNQSFPRVSRYKLRKEIDPGPLIQTNMERIRGDGLNTCSFSAGRTRGSFPTGRFPDVPSARPIQPANDGSNIKSLQGISDSAWSFSSSFISAVGASSSYPITAMNPNKAVFTIDIKSSQILVVNGMACGLLGYSPDELGQMKIHQLLNEKHKTQITALAEEQLDPKDGNMVVLSGKVVEMLTKDEKVIPVSLWLRKLEAEGRCLAVAEPVERRIAQLVIDCAGCIMSADSETAVIFQYEADELEGMDIATLVPAIKLPGHEGNLTKDVKKQKATGRTREGATFPLCLRMAEEPVDDKNIDSYTTLYSVVIWVFANMSGLVVLNESGTIESCNHHFTHMMFGYPQSELIGQKVTCIIPNFCDDLEYMGDSTVTLPHFDVNKVEDDNDNSNYDSAVENIDQDKSRSSSAMLESDYSTPGGRDSVTVSSKGENDALGSSCGDNSCDNTDKDLANGNHSLSTVDDLVDSLNRLNLEFNDELSSSLSLFCSLVNIKQRSVFTISSSSVSAITGSESVSAKVVPPSTLNLPTNISSDLVGDPENCSDNGELTPVVSPHIDFVEDEDHFETASDDEDSIEILTDDQEAKVSDVKLDLDLLSSSEKALSSTNPLDWSTKVNNSVTSTSLNIDSELTNTSSNFANFSDLSEKMDRIKIELSDKRYSLVESSNALKFDGIDDVSVIPRHSHSLDDGLERPLDMQLTSTPAVNSKRILKRVFSKDLEVKTDTAQKRFPDGSFVGFGRHKDGSNLDVLYRVRGIILSSGRTVYCVWVSRDPEELGEGGRNCAGNLTLTSSFNSTVDNSLGQAIRSCAQSNVPQGGNRSGSVSVLSQCEDDQTCGEYSELYTTLQQIGKGAFGYVKMAFRNSDGLLVITKFIQKQKVHQQSWVDDPILGRKVPLEISLLTTLKHPNIVQVLDVFENPKFFQLVMEKHGAGMDLFEFIDRKPYLDEALNSYIFRQIVSAVEYLHSLQILHRDIKDENVIINERFHAKLIDFGSATFMSEGRLFSTFYGTVEYCSPEVLAGNKYEGPELEMWSLGVTLYVMTFGENPFFDVEEIMKAELHPPCKVSEELMSLLHWMLAKDPRERCRVSELVAHQWVNQDVDMSSYSFQDIVSCHPQEAHPPVYYAEYRCDSANDSLSNRFPVTESSSALLSNNDEESNADDRTVGSSNSLGSLTTVENFETEEELQALAVEPKLVKIEEIQGEELEHITPSSTANNIGKVTHCLEEEEELVALPNGALCLESEIPEIADEDDSWDPDYYYEEDSFS